MKIYLAGSVPKGDKEAAAFIDWRKVYTDAVKKDFPDAQTVDPNMMALEGDSLAVTGADCLLIQQADIVIVNAEEKLGAGTSMELVVAKYLRKPVVTVLPKNTHHRRSNLPFEGRIVTDWIHPFVDTFSDFILEDIKDFHTLKEKLKTQKIKSIDVIDKSIDYYKRIRSSV